MTTTDDRTPPGDASPRVRTELAISGMTCGACSARIERRLARLDDVDASVNLTTERARVEHSPDRPVADLVALVEKLGFGAEVIPAATSAAPTAPVTASVTVPTARTAPDDAAAPAPTGPATGAVPATDGATTPPTTAAPADPTEAPPAPDPELADLRHRAFTCLALTVPVVAVAMIGSLQVTYWQWFSLMLAAPVVVWGGWRFHRSAARHLRHGQVTMDTLVSLGSLAALGWSLGALFIGEAGLGGVRHNLTLIPRPDFYGGDRTIYLETGAAIITAVLFGRWIELRGRRRALAGSATHDPRPTRNARLRVPTANGVRELLVPVENLTVGDEVSVAPGAVVPCDGIVVSGRAALDVAAMTGESAPAEAGPGTHVLAGTRSHHDGADGPLVVRATAVGDATQWARMGRHVADAQVGKASVQRLADRVSAFFVPAVLVLAVYTLVFWWFADGPDIAAAAAMAVLVVACPCALGLATPTALAVATGRGATLGILLRGPETLEATRRIDTVVLDKTGTLTTGDMTLHGVTVADGTHAGQVWRMVTALERDVDHPVARALLAAAPDAPAAPATRVERLDGLGVRGTLDGVEVLVGRPLLHERHHAVLDDDLAAARRAAEAAGHTVVLVSWPDSSDGTSDAASDRSAAAPRVRAVLAVGDTVRDSSAEGVARMRAMGLRPMLVTGDNAAAAAAVAAQVGIDGDDVVADVLPTDKADTVTRLQDAGHVVAMVGDGINDAAALARADLGMAMGAGTTLALDAADITLVRNDLRTVTDALRLARRTLRTIRGNLFWAFAYNTAALPLAALGLLNPMIAGLAMALSSIFVVGNSLRLRRFALRAGAEGTSGRG